MFRYRAFLRAVNVGGHTVKMDQLRRLFEELNYDRVETYIASGNVIFEASSNDAGLMENQIETALRSSLGYEVTAFLRSDRELAALARYAAFTPAQITASTAYNVAFLKETPSATAAHKLMSLRNEIDDFHLHGREIYWLCKFKQSDSKFSNAVLEKTLGGFSTLRSMNTIQKMAEKYLAG